VSMSTRRGGTTHLCQGAIRDQQRGYTLLELLISLVIGSILLLALNGLIGQGLQTYEAVNGQNELNRQVRFAMEQMVRAVSRSTQLLLPLNDNPATNWPENIREETVPPTPPVGDSTRASAALAVTLDRTLDLDRDGTPDADQDGDGRFDEDPGGDRTNDQAPGIYLIDDDGDGQVDEGGDSGDDDEDGAVAGEDPLNGLDDDGDGNIDEDPGTDTNLDGCPGVCGVDEDGDGLIDETPAADDDEDGAIDEDWLDPVVFYLDNGTLMQRTPVPWDVSGSGGVRGRDFVTHALAENVSRFRVERLPQAGERAVQVKLVLELTDPRSGDSVGLETRVRVGGDL
jgi:prepilin-type N-terminal cleavage/methylation domain-containing protein